MIDQQGFFGTALNSSRDSMTMARTEYQRLENQKVQSALKNLDSIGFGVLSHWETVYQS